MRTYIPEARRRRVRKTAGNRCGYCLSPQHLVLVPLEIEHIIPLSKGGTNDESNLWLACANCNRHKGSRTTAIDSDSGEVVSLFNPRLEKWDEHFQWSSDGLTIIGKTKVGRATVLALGLNQDADVILVRSYWIQAGWHPPTSSV